MVSAAVSGHGAASSPGPKRVAEVGPSSENFDMAVCRRQIAIQRASRSEKNTMQSIKESDSIGNTGIVYELMFIYNHDYSSSIFFRSPNLYPSFAAVDRRAASLRRKRHGHLTRDQLPAGMSSDSACSVDTGERSAGRKWLGCCRRPRALSVSSSSATLRPRALMRRVRSRLSFGLIAMSGCCCVPVSWVRSFFSIFFNDLDIGTQ